MSRLVSRALARPTHFVVRLALIGVLASAGAVGLALVGQTAANATPSCDKTWTGANSSSWTVAGNWSPSGQPSSSQYACINSGTNQPSIANGANITIAGMQLNGTMTLTLNGTGALTLADTTGTKSSEMSGGTVQGTGTLTIGANHVFNWTGGLMQGTGSTVIAAGGQGAFSPTGNYDALYQRTLTNNGSITYTPDASGYTLWLGYPNCDATTTFNNNGTFTYNGLNAGDPGISACGTSATINNTGTFTKSAGTANPPIGPAFNNSGTVTAQAGTLALSGGSATGTGSFGATGGATISLAGGTFNLGNGSTFTGGVSIDGATVTIGNAATLTLTGTNGFTNGTIDGAGTMTVNGTLNWTGGIMQGAGSTVISVGGQGVLVSPTGNYNAIDGRTFTNNGSITYTPDASGYNLWLGYPTCANTTTFTNNGTFTYNGLNASDPGISGCGTALIHNVGTFSRSGGTASAAIQPALDNDGVVTASTGALSFLGGGGTGETGTGTFGTGGGGLVSLDSGVYHLSGATFSGEGAINGATVFADGALTVNSMSFANGAIDGAGTMTVNGTLNWTGGIMQGAGSTVISVGGQGMLSPTGNYNAIDGRTFTNNGSITYTPDASGYNLWLGYPTCANTTTFTNNGTFTYNGLNASEPGISACGTATITNNGTFTKTAGTASAPVGPDFDNNGTIGVQTGTLQFNGAFPAYNSGTKTLTKGTYNVAGTLQWVGADVVANAATISLDGAGSAIQSTSATNALANFASNSGSLTVKNGRSLTTKAFTNTGTVVIGPGTNSTLTSPGSGYTQNTGGASTALTAATSKLITSAATGNVTINGGTLSGIGTVQTAAGKTLTNGATVSPGSSPGILTATANYSQTAGGSLPIEIGGTTAGTQYDRVAVTGNASLNGTLALSTINGFVPTAGQTFDVLTYTGTLTGTFSSVTGDNLDGLNQGLFYKVLYNTSGIVKVEVHQAQLAIGDVTLTEPNTGTVNADFAVTLTDSRTNGVSVNYATADGTATAPADYTNTSGTLTWAAGDSATKHILVPVKADALDENNETFTVSLSANSHASIQDGSGLGTIQDDAADVAPTISINDVSQNEGQSGTSSFGFTASLSAPSGKTITANYGTADGTATAPSDYAAASGGLTFNPGDTSKPVSVTVNGDTTVEPNETFVVNLTGLVNVSAGDTQGQGTILNDEGCTAPVVTGYNKPAQAVGKKITVLGSCFTGATSVAFTKAGGGTVNGTAMQVLSDGQISVKVPNLAATGPVSVTSPGGTGSGPTLKIKATIADFNPKTGPVGTQVILTGSAFTGTTKVQFGTKTASFTVNNDGQITTNVPTGATTAVITITTPGGKAKTKVVFTVT